MQFNLNKEKPSVSSQENAHFERRYIVQIVAFLKHSIKHRECCTTQQL
jgi:hypothetical protein